MFLPVLIIIMSLTVLRDVALFSSIQTRDPWAILVGSAAVLVALLLSMIMLLLPFEKSFSNVGGS